MTRAVQLQREIDAALSGSKLGKPLSDLGGLRLKRRAPGFYEGHAMMKLDDEPTAVTISISQQETGKRWYHGIRRADDDALISEGEDTYATKRDALAALEEVLTRGMRHSNWGWTT